MDSRVPSHSLPPRQCNFYAFVRTSSFSAGGTNGGQKAFNGRRPALKAALCFRELSVLCLIRTPGEVWASKCNQAVFPCSTLPPVGLRIDSFRKAWAIIMPSKDPMSPAALRLKQSWQGLVSEVSLCQNSHTQSLFSTASLLGFPST